MHNVTGNPKYTCSAENAAGASRGVTCAVTVANLGKTSFSLALLK